MIELLHRDDEVVVVAKPAGLIVHRGGDAGQGDEAAALQATRDLVGAHVYPVHRLDRGASGALMFALSSAAARRLHDAIEAGAVDKGYWALVRGAPPATASIDHPIPRREDGPPVPAQTEVRRLAVAEVAKGPSGGPQRYALVEARLITGRRHQVRRHLKHLGHPLVGDVNYGRGEHNRFFRAHFGFGRLALHARALAWTAKSGARIEVVAPLPEDFADVLRRLGIEVPQAGAKFPP